MTRATIHYRDKNGHQEISADLPATPHKGDIFNVHGKLWRVDEVEHQLDRDARANTVASFHVWLKGNRP